MRDTTNWARLLAFVTGLVNQELLLQNEYLVAENRILKAHLPDRLRLSDPERCTLAEIGKRLGRKGLKLVAHTVKPDTILAWYRRLVARKFDGSRCRAYPGRPRIPPKVEGLVVRFARENSGWGYDRIVGALYRDCGTPDLVPLQAARLHIRSDMRPKLAAIAYGERVHTRCTLAPYGG
jgi:putative transposase